jgi:hypothetical protein
MPSPSRSTDEKKLPRLETRQLLFSGNVAVVSWPSGRLAQTAFSGAARSQKSTNRL